MELQFSEIESASLSKDKMVDTLARLRVLVSIKTKWFIVKRD